MELTQDILLPVLLAAILANTVILLLVVVATRSRRQRVGHSATRSAIQGSMLSTSFVDRTGSSTWSSNGEVNGAATEAVDGATDPDTEAQAEDAFPDRAEPEPDDSATEVDVASETPEIDASAGVDALTGLMGPGAFTRVVVAEDGRIQRYHRSATVVIFELGGLDRLVDRLGADAADRVVPALADTMRRLARDVDHVARLAPGRFGVLLPETDEVAAINYVERVRRACELWLESGAIALSLAAGWAGTTGDPTLLEAQRLATDRMYVELRREARKAVDR
ncbi:MAG TPA: diguanylate cyclase [Methylomirabilota bacterium]|nr:diguanylate cyclase [Methylomirabilota bacterium]